VAISPFSIIAVFGPQAPFTAILGSLSTSSEEAVAVLDDEEIGAWGVLDEDEFSFWTEDEVADEGPSCDKGVSSDDSIGICEASLEGDGVSGLVGSSPHAERPKNARPLTNKAGTVL
jgi:hypothetical protein